MRACAVLSQRLSGAGIGVLGVLKRRSSLPAPAASMDFPGNDAVAVGTPVAGLAEPSSRIFLTVCVRGRAQCNKTLRRRSFAAQYRLGEFAADSTGARISFERVSSSNLSFVDSSLLGGYHHGIAHLCIATESQWEPVKSTAASNRMDGITDGALAADGRGPCPDERT